MSLKKLQNCKKIATNFIFLIKACSKSNLWPDTPKQQKTSIYHVIQASNLLGCCRPSRRSVPFSSHTTRTPGGAVLAWSCGNRHSRAAFGCGEIRRRALRAPFLGGVGGDAPRSLVCVLRFEEENEIMNIHEGLVCVLWLGEGGREKGIEYSWNIGPVIWWREKDNVYSWKIDLCPMIGWREKYRPIINIQWKQKQERYIFAQIFLSIYFVFKTCDYI